MFEFLYTFTFALKKNPVLVPDSKTFRSLNATTFFSDTSLKVFEK